MSLRHQRSPHRFHVDRFVAAHLPRTRNFRGLDIGGPSPQRRPPGQYWEVANLPARSVEELGTAFAGRHPFDVVQCTDMIYLVADVPRALREMRRVLKPGGLLVMTAPFLWPPTGAPGDWGRWTDAEWYRQVCGAGFTADPEKVLCRPLGGAWTYLEQLVRAYADWWPPLFFRLDRTHRWPLSYGIVARA